MTISERNCHVKNNRENRGACLRLGCDSNQQEQKQIPEGNDRKKGKGNYQ
jgi:hypothetical protein